MRAYVLVLNAGSSSLKFRARICDSPAWLGVELGRDANAHGGPPISTAASRVSAFVIPTNEELMIATHTGARLGLTRGSGRATSGGTRRATSGGTRRGLDRSAG